MTDGEPPATFVDKATVTQLRTVGKCPNGDDIVVVSRLPVTMPGQPDCA